MLRPGSAPRASPQTGVPQARWWRRRPARPSAGYQAGTGRAEQYGQFVVLEVPAVIDAVAEQGQTPRGKMPRPWPDRVTSGPSSAGTARRRPKSRAKCRAAPGCRRRSPGHLWGDGLARRGTRWPGHAQRLTASRASGRSRPPRGKLAWPRWGASPLTMRCCASSSWPHCSAFARPCACPALIAPGSAAWIRSGRCGGRARAVQGALSANPGDFGIWPRT